jgi:hypothetical protein
MSDMPESDVREFRLDEVLGRQVLARNGVPIGRLEELRCTGPKPYEVTEYVIGLAGLLDRLHLIRAVVGLQANGFIATARQLDLTDPSKPLLTCELSELRRL